MDNAKIARMFCCTVEQVRELRKKNIAQLSSMEQKAIATGKKINGYTAQELRTMREETEANNK